MKLVGSIQARYGYTQARAQKAWDAFMSGIDDAEERVADTASVGATARKGWRRAELGTKMRRTSPPTAHDVGDTARKAWDRASTGVKMRLTPPPTRRTTWAIGSTRSPRRTARRAAMPA
ncbi:MAG: hypothetical protein U0470_06025 [Anaerolineae bacterium]